MAQNRDYRHIEMMRAMGRRPTERMKSLQSRALVMPESRPIDTMWLFFGAAFLTMLLTISVVILKTKLSPTPYIYGPKSEQINYGGEGPGSKRKVIEQLTREQRRQQLVQVRYVAEIIKGLDAKGKLDTNGLANSIVAESNKANIDPLFVAAVIKSESTFKHQAVSHMGALGLMQVMPATGKFISMKDDLGWHGHARLKDPQYNIRVGIAYLKHMQDMFEGDSELALIAYNWGPANLSAALKTGRRIPGSPRRYAQQILDDHNRWSLDYLDRRVELSDELLEMVG